MTPDNSRNFPTTQEFFVGKFRLADLSDLSDISAMATVEQVRETIRAAIEKEGKGAVAVALELKLERNYLRDFIEGRKQSIKTEVAFALVKRYSIPIKKLLIA